MEIIILVTIFLMGLCVGSFINMAVYRYAVKNGLEERLPRSLRSSLQRRASAMTKNRSFCDFCGKQLRWYENIPVVSWIILGGKSSCCKKKLSVLYPIVETATGILFLIFIFIFNQFSIFYLITGLIIITLIVFSAVVDLKYMILPDRATLILIILSLILFYLGQPQRLPMPEILSALGAAGFLGLLYWLTKGKGMGFGDVKLALFMGILLGFPKIIMAFYVAFVVGAIVGVGLMLMRKAKRKTHLPFGPFLFLGTVVAWWWGNSIWYMVFGI